MTAPLPQLFMHSMRVLLAIGSLLACGLLRCPRFHYIWGLRRLRSLISALDLGAGRAVLAHSVRGLSTSWRAPERDAALAGIGAADDVPIARRLMVCRESEHRFE